MNNMKYIASGIVSGVLHILITTLTVSVFRDSFEKTGFIIICAIEALYVLIIYFPFFKTKISKIFILDLGSFLCVQLLDFIYLLSPLPVLIPRTEDAANPGNGIGIMIYSALFLCCMIFARLIVILMSVLIQKIRNDSMRFRYDRR